ncbi:MAG: flagellar basal-body rod modification protein FlgD [Verrucomicrobiota bacterium]
MEIAPINADTTHLGFETSRLPTRTLGQDDFLKLIVAQLTSQDPLNPQKDTEFIAQMAQFSQLEQAKTMQSDIAALRIDQAFMQASAMLGRSVELRDAHGALTQGVVTSIQLDGGTPKIVVNGQPHYLDEVVAISPAAATDPVTPPGGNGTPPMTVTPPVIPPATITPE